MGAWDTGSFGNDVALDYVADLKGISTARKTVTTLVKSPDGLDADDASMALAACDLLAAAIGRPPADLPDDLPRLQKKSVTDELLDTAKTLVKHIGKSSELAELWAEEDLKAWKKELKALELRLTPSKPYKAPKRKALDFPDDFLGHCYVCYGPVTKRDGIRFEIEEDWGSMSCHPHRACVEKDIPGPHWNDDGSPTEAMRLNLMRHMGYDV